MENENSEKSETEIEKSDVSDIRIDNDPDKKINISKIKNNVKKNPWMISTIVLGIIALILLVMVLRGGITGGVIGVGNTISAEEAGENIIDYLNLIGVDESTIILNDIKKVNNLYEVYISAGGQEGILYVSQDGEIVSTPRYKIEEALSSTQIQQDQQAQQPTDVPKSDKPVLEAFLSPFCPYGLQYMKGLIPVYNLLKDKADINIKYIGITHMGLEEPETMRQLCILNEYGKDELFAYLENIIYTKEAETCYNDWHSGEYARDDARFNECMGPIITKAFNEINIDENKVNSCIEKKGGDYFNSAVEYARSQNVRGSPTPKINGVGVSGRSSELIKNAICDAFNERPEECSTELSSSTPSPGMGGESGADTQAQAQC